ncbi:putative E3 ubiquitin-protein ligase BAH1-like protein [Auxenochlorella protothecoides]|uniref:Putative E3 ubiquitin-protein ligase BAH1-like protein n=1 Tax=Auxenochlorella protothecoides TaxID=3075 RepID=A0A087SBM2_AUXPR|nr:putative E3 ubiquitin-protein ligase BAH1-like protein [Auxenochlorella protothecoides]KFM23126.1 putative E3 ubiquitin-protein ligase BAH1-like protein [Auxenochlorella protothecoides]
MGPVRRPSPNPQLRNVSHRYKELKKLLKPLSSEQSQENGGPEAGEQALGPAAEHDEEVFFSTLRAQMKVVDRQFQKQAWATITAFERSQFRNPALCFLCVFRWRTADKNSRLAQQAYWCMKFAKANAVALRKILKKHDKDWLYEQGPKPADTPEDEADLACPICLEVMYKPVGLVCGHKFCKRCVLEAAGFGRAMGTFSSIVSHVPRRSVCPECRQPDVYRGAVSLREVGKLIAARHPQAWAERRREDRERERAAADRMLNETMDSYRPVLRASSVYELLF